MIITRMQRQKINLWLNLNPNNTLTQWAGQTNNCRQVYLCKIYHIGGPSKQLLYRGYIPRRFTSPYRSTCRTPKTFIGHKPRKTVKVSNAMPCPEQSPCLAKLSDTHVLKKTCVGKKDNISQFWHKDNISQYETTEKNSSILLSQIIFKHSEKLW
jgi:hypothetical protein